MRANTLEAPPRAGSKPRRGPSRSGKDRGNPLGPVTGTADGSAAARRDASDARLHRVLGFWPLFAISLGGIIGSGWLFGVLRAASLAGPAAILSWVLGGALALVLVFSWAAMARRVPRSGGSARYAVYSHGHLAGFLLGWIRLVSMATIPTIEAEAVVTALQVLLDRSHAGFAVTYTTVFGGTPVTTLNAFGVALAFALLTGFFLLNYAGARRMGEVTTAVTVWKVAIPVATILALAAIAEPGNLGLGAGSASGFAPYGPAAILFAVATSGVMFAYLGFAQAVDYAGEARRPDVDLPRALLASTAVAMAIYVGLQVAFVGAVDWANAGVPRGDWAALAGSSWGALPLYFALLAGSGAAFAALGYLLLTDAWVSPTETGWIYLGTSARALYGLSVEGYLPAGLSRVHARLGVPVGAVVAAFLLGAVFLLPLPSWYEFIAFISGALVVSYATAPVALTAFLRAERGARAVGSRRGNWLAAIAGFLVVGAVLYWSGFVVLTWLLVAVYAGLVVFLAAAAPRYLGLPPREARAAAGVAAVGLGAMTLLGPAYTTWTGAGLVPSSATLSLWRPGDGPSLAAYLLLVGVVGLAVFLYLARRADAEGRRHVRSAAWLLPWLYGIYLLSYAGEFGPMAPGRVGGSIAFPYARLLTFPWGTLAALALTALVLWDVARSGQVASARSDPSPAG